MFSLMKFSWVYITTNKRNGTLYTGVTSDLVDRIWKHKHDWFPGFSRKYGCNRLVWFETHNDIHAAMRREKQIKRWRRTWKLRLIEEQNPNWTDLYEDLTNWVPDNASGISGMTPNTPSPSRHPGFRKAKDRDPANARGNESTSNNFC